MSSRPKRLALLLVILFVGVISSGCTTYWYKPGVTEQEFARDSYECERDARMLPRTPQSITRGAYGQTIYSDPTLGWGDVAAQAGMFERCMAAKGYTKTGGSDEPRSRVTVPAPSGPPER